MKKSLLALAALTAFAGAASAQSSVTLFGIVDLNLRNQDNGSAGSRKSMSQDGIASSRLGFRGVEDIGGGMKAGFWLEGAINPDTGTPGGQTWQRRSTLSLMSGVHELRLGRDYAPTYWNHTAYDVFGTVGVGASSNAWSNLGSGATTQVRVNNSVAYHLNAGGLWVWLMASAGEAVVGNKYMGGRVNYAAGPLSVGFAYGKTDIGASPDFKEWNAAASFNAGFATLFLQYSKNDWGAADQKQFHLGARVPMGNAALKASFNKWDGNTANRDAKQFALGLDYALSKRTALYTTYSRLDNGGSTTGGATFVTSGSGPAGIKGGENSTGYEFGIRHSF
jgi:predicted porin